jgi:hypothetical protein
MMLAEIYLLHLEAKLRANPNEAPRVVSTSPLVRFDIKPAVAIQSSRTK